MWSKRRGMVRALLWGVVFWGGSWVSSVMGATVGTQVCGIRNSTNLSMPATVATKAGSVVNNTSFALTYGSGLSGNVQAQNAFNMAAARWSAVLGDPVTLNLNLDYQPLGEGILGQSSSILLQAGYSTIRDMMAAGGDTGSAVEALLPNLPTVGEFSGTLPTGFSFDGTMLLTQANYLALGGSRISSTDGSITFSSNFAWDFDPTDGITAGTYDFVGVACHEIGHSLGFVSEVDYVDYVLSLGQTASDVTPRPLDMFRFNTSSLGAGFDFTTTSRYFVPGGSHSFYYGSGTVLMSTGVNIGDGRQASHWKDNLGLGLMDPTGAPGELLEIQPNDLIAMDLIGWQIVPEPTTIAILSLCLLWLRRR